MIFFIALNFGAKYLLCHFIFSGKRMITHNVAKCVCVLGGRSLRARTVGRETGRKADQRREKKRKKQKKRRKQKKMSELVIRSESKVSPTLGRASS